MANLPEKLRIFKAKNRLRFRDFSEHTGATIQAVKNWTDEDRCPLVIKREFAEKLVEFCQGEISLKDCGHETQIP